MQKPNENMYDRVLAAYNKEHKNTEQINRAWFELQPQLVICGGGHVSVQVAKIAKMLDFYVQVIDDREEFANTQNFPEADEVCCHDFHTLSEIFPKEKNTYYVVVTRGHAADQICVEQILKEEYTYLGMIGSKSKVKETFEQLIQEGYDAEQVNAIHSPIGLAIKAQTPAEIAVSIMSEIILCKNSHSVSSISRELAKSDKKGTLCIITAKTGSGPRGVGSMMLVDPKGQITGTIGGGSIEHEVIKEAVTITAVSQKSYDLSNSESAGLGMICGGNCEITFIPLT